MEKDLNKVSLKYRIRLTLKEEEKLKIYLMSFMVKMKTINLIF